MKQLRSNFFKIKKMNSYWIKVGEVKRKNVFLNITYSVSAKTAAKKSWLAL